MNQLNPLGVDDLIRELGAGRAMVNFMLDRFSSLFSPYLTHGDHQYVPGILPKLIRIRDMLSSGMLPTQIEALLEIENKNAPDISRDKREDKSDNGDIRMNREALSFIQDMVKDIRGQQERIAAAHEKRAEAEERKAVAIEKRADAEEKKAAAMNNIAAALQEMNQLRAVDAHAMEIAGQAAHALILDSNHSEQPVLDPPAARAIHKNSHDAVENHLEDLGTALDADQTDVETRKDTDITIGKPLVEKGKADGLSDDGSREPVSLTDIDDLSLLVDNPVVSHDDIDDLFTLVDTGPDSQAIDVEDLDALSELELLDENPPPLDLDDLSLLLDAPSPSHEASDTMDDLTQLVATPESGAPLDDLSARIDKSAIENQELPTPDISLAKDETSKPMDDLWMLVNADDDDRTQNGEDQHARLDESLDNLSALIDPETPVKHAEPDLPSLRPDITPQEDLSKYKSAVMKIIIELKSKGLSAKETTDKLNKDGVATLSGKPSWAENAILKIYGFIDSAS